MYLQKTYKRMVYNLLSYKYHQAYISILIMDDFKNKLKMSILLLSGIVVVSLI